MAGGRRVPPTQDAGERLRRGHAQGRTMLGHRWDRVVEAVEKADPVFASYVTEFAYGEIYPRPGLDLRSRELVAVTCLTLQGLRPQLKTHVLAALEVGVTEEELLELFIHLALYAGFPTALFGLTTAREVLDERAPSHVVPAASEGASPA